MGEANTHNLPDGRSFEERVFARFDALDAHMRTLDGRMDKLDGRMDKLDGRMDKLDERVQRIEVEAERRALETKPIWERALAEIVEVREAVYHLSRKVDALGKDMLHLRADQARVEERMDRLEAERRG